MGITTKRIELEHGIALHLREMGEGKPTLLVHGWGVPGTVWDPVLARWTEAAGRVLAPDLRGTGWSAKPREGYTLEDDVRDVVALIDELELSDLALVGHSKGGAIAQAVALERPKALRKLVLVSPVPASGVALDEPTIAYFESMCGHREGASTLIGAMLAMTPEPALLEALVASMASVCIESLLGGFAAWRNANFGDRIGAIETPTTVLSGAAEQVLSPELMRTMVVEKIPGATLELIPGAGHYPQIECPDPFTAMLLAAIG
ncbi:hydrolase, alpha/beta fold family protein [Plesiocystis pacifica SIR-1]|uniref:Hydrolase, alpha/beta fold family protein n=1 Tax=Plesiocystis pacifica SIR-1 TaxID=391625 RepID=A6GEE1_9BACT|nr:alpha/beta fold hydrolase [Plesiocystis pacifica]EDM75782.1 hydrolase, alpha/beta fold family protein [Plesiocystis pacifica SIR-1]